MKYIKTFEAKRGLEDILKDYQYYIEDLDEISPITFDYFFDNLDFDIFDSGKDFYSAGINLPQCTTAKSLNFKGSVLYRSQDYGPICQRGFENNIDYIKRNTFFYAEVNTGGFTGGNCWNEDDLYEYSGESFEMTNFIYSYLQPILENILYSQANTKTAKQLCDLILESPQVIPISEDYRTNYEYYGNSDNYECRYIRLENLFKFLAQNEGF